MSHGGDTDNDGMEDDNDDDGDPASVFSVE